MDKSCLKYFLLALLCCSALTPAFGEPQLTLGLGQASLAGAEFPYKGNNASLEYTFNPFSRMQFGLKYDNTSAVLGKRTFYDCAGLLGTFKIVLNTLSGKSPYFGFNFGWLNSTLADETIIYNARGSFTGESIGGYTFRIDDYNRWNIEYRNRYVQLKLADKELQRSETIVLSWSMILDEANFQQPVRKLTPEEGLLTKKEYLQQKITYNNAQIKKYDGLIGKYNQRILTEGSSEQLVHERDFLLQQKKELETDNQKMWDILEH